MRLERSKTHLQKCGVIAPLTLPHLLSLGGLVALFAPHGRPALSPHLGTLMVAATTLWLLTALLAVNIAHYVMRRS